MHHNFYNEGSDQLWIDGGCAKTKVDIILNFIDFKL